MILTDEELKLLKRAIGDVWQQIGPDVLESAFETDNECCIEACIDADRLVLNCPYGDEEEGKQAQTLVRRMIADAGYGPTLRYLARHINLN